MTDRLSLSELTTSPRHALLRGLRQAGNESQLTQVIGAISTTDPVFASRFVDLLLRQAAKDPRHAAAVKRMGRPPAELECKVEHSLRDDVDARLGRVDLRFDGGDDFTLFVENKLHSGFGDLQLERYKAALDLLPVDRRRRGLVAVTRDVPSFGELDPGTDGWLGGVRWAHLLRAGLRDLPVADAEVRGQWPVLLDILDAQGDLGVTRVDATLVNSWASYLDGRKILVDLLDDIRQPVLEIIRRELSAKYPRAGTPGKLCAPLAHGKGKVVVKTAQSEVRTGYRIPARCKEAVLSAVFYAREGAPHFAIEAWPIDGYARLDRGESSLVKASRQLLRAGFDAENGCWWRQHAGTEFLRRKDVSLRLLEFAEADIREIVQSGLLSKDIK